MRERLDWPENGRQLRKLMGSERRKEGEWPLASRPMAGGGGGRGGSAGVSILFNFVRTMLRAGSSLTGGILQVQKGDLKT